MIAHQDSTELRGVPEECESGVWHGIIIRHVHKHLLVARVWVAAGQQLLVKLKRLSQIRTHIFNNSTTHFFGFIDTHTHTFNALS